MSTSGRAALTLSTALMASWAIAQTVNAQTAAGTVQLEEEAQRIEQKAEQQEQRAQEIDVQLREAEERLAEAAARIAELSRRRLPETYAFERRIRIGDRPMLGVTIGTDNDQRGPVEGVTIRGVTPGSAAAEAGLRSGDVITAVNDESLSAASDEEANRRLLDFLEGVEDGDTLDVEYLRGGKSAAVDVKPRAMPGQVVTFGPSEGAFRMRALPAPVAPGVPAAPNVFSYFMGDGSWGDMEMVSLTDDLGRYFGTDKGLLVVRAPKHEKFKLRDGDVIQRIDGREPTSVSHAMRILGSYQGGETLKLEIMRDRKRETLSVEVPDNRSSFLPGLEHFAPPVEAGEVAGADVVRERT